ncbi:hypothetical protein [Oscillatoria sp. FACHB-1406]|uniref:hypothetical protein n=1 Tax=Oscillatoria sp. FACHB-1406 TaxID=2692846 RepID=UPI0016898E2B|nr:hypothetical protein [Oscillatoria sp. FACHB-1406]MBD2577868.1 hypothetical protein [Oscillatoria sp. FACHB-1406]
MRGFTEGEDWIVLVEKQEDRNSQILTRRIITFRKIGDSYRRDEEIHRQQLYRATELAAELTRIGFQVKTTRGSSQYPLPGARAALIARKS